MRLLRVCQKLFRFFSSNIISVTYVFSDSYNAKLSSVEKKKINLEYKVKEKILKTEDRGSLRKDRMVRKIQLT